MIFSILHIVFNHDFGTKPEPIDESMWSAEDIESSFPIMLWAYDPDCSITFD